MSAVKQEKRNARSADEILERRLDHARFLLTQTGVPLEAIAAAGGWDSEDSFADAFENRVGVAPLRYRRWHQPTR